MKQQRLWFVYLFWVWVLFFAGNLIAGQTPTEDEFVLNSFPSEAQTALENSVMAEEPQKPESKGWGIKGLGLDWSRDWGNTRVSLYLRENLAVGWLDQTGEWDLNPTLHTTNDPAANIHTKIHQYGGFVAFSFKDKLLEDCWQVHLLRMRSHRSYTTAEGKVSTYIWTGNGILVGYRWIWKNGLNIPIDIGRFESKSPSLADHLANNENILLGGILKEDPNRMYWFGVSIGYIFN